MTEPSVTALSSQSVPSTTACMNSSVTRTELLAFWYWIEWLSLPSRSMSKPSSRRTRAFFSSIDLHQMKSWMSGWSMSRMTIFAARRVLPPDLIVPARRVGAAHEADRARRGAAALEQLARRADLGDVEAGAGAALEDDSFLRVPVEDRLHLVVDGEDEARRALLRHALHADVEPHRRVERGALGDEQVLELVGERGGLFVVGEVAVLLAPRQDRVDDAIDDLLQRPLALRRCRGCRGSTSGRGCSWR